MTVDVEIEHDAWLEALPDVEARVRRAGEAALGKVKGEVVVLLRCRR